MALLLLDRQGSVCKLPVLPLIEPNGSGKESAGNRNGCGFHGHAAGNGAGGFGVAAPYPVLLYWVHPSILSPVVSVTDLLAALIGMVGGWCLQLDDLQRSLLTAAV